MSVASDGELPTEWRPLAGMARASHLWRELAAGAGEPNVFYEPAFALAARPLHGHDAGAVLVWSRDPPRHLIGMFPARIEERRFGLKLPLLVGWTHPFGPLGTPLIERGAAERVVGAFLDHVARDRELPKLVLLPYVEEGGEFAGALRQEVARRGLRFGAFGRHRRAMLVPGDDRATYFERALGAKRRKELGRLWRRLSEAGPVSIDVARAPSTIAEAMPDFLALEASGWKGRAHTAAMQDAQVEIFMRDAVRELAAEGKARVMRLVHDGRTIAAAIALISGDTAWFWKIAYDEAHARASPGVQLALHLSRALLAEPAIARVDSCATPDHSMIDHLWRERLSLADYMFAVKPQAAGIFMLARGLEAVARRARVSARILRGAIGRR